MKMIRRSFLSLMPALALARPRRRIAITMDDVNWAAVPPAFTDTVLPRILEAIGSTRAALFVVGRNVENEEGRGILDAWSRAGHLLGNHTYDHGPLYRVGPKALIEGIERNGKVLESFPAFRKWFRFPQLKEGDSREERDFLRDYLVRAGYRNAHVTVDASDWYYDQRLRKKLEEAPAFPLERFREPYVAHIRDRVGFYDRLCEDVLGRSVPHVLLTHYNLLNALFLKDVLRALDEDGWERIDVEEAYADPVYRDPVDAIPAGESLIWSIAHASGKYEDRLRYPGEDGEYEKPLLDRLGL
jgi:peptidoglycan/xylan/chitin deacetylase (PgdA/CDA1 family)